jgi:ABC-type antimicrobial peptide transport system permease subunit
MRATGRHREVAIRTAIGAGRGQIVMQMLVEGLLLSGLGAVVGLALGLAGVRGLLGLLGAQVPGEPAVTLNLPMLGMALALAAATGVIFGLVPALAPGASDINAVLRDDSARGTASRSAGQPAPASS